MSHKIFKKLRKYHREDLKDELILLKALIRNKPRWMPKFVYKGIVKFVIPKIKL